MIARTVQVSKNGDYLTSLLENTVDAFLIYLAGVMSTDYLVWKFSEFSSASNSSCASRAHPCLSYTYTIYPFLAYPGTLACRHLNEFGRAASILGDRVATQNFSGSLHCNGGHSPNQNQD
jgi:hypothetical protein